MSGEPRLRAVTPADDVDRVIRTAFGEEGERVARLWDEVERTGLSLGSIVAECGTEVVGHVGLSTAWLDARRDLVEVWLLSPLSVLPAHRRRGTGTALVAAAVEAARAGGAPLLFLEGSPAYYGARGFDRARDHGFEAPSARTPDKAFQVVCLPGHQDWMTGRVVYRDVWWRHDAAGLRDPLLAEVEAALGDA